MGCSPTKRKKQSYSITNSIKAAILIQKWYRNYRARMEVRRRYTWNIFQSIEYAGEQDQLKLHNFFNNMLVNMAQDDDGEVPLVKAFQVNKNFSIYDTHAQEDCTYHVFEEFLDDIKVESSYKGPQLTFPLTLDQFHQLVQAFKKKTVLHARYLIELLLEVRKVLKTQPNIRYASTSLSKQITVCGDFHGKLSDLYMVFYKNGLPAIDNPYIFNGDFVDRGLNSTEVSIILFSCFLMNNNEVFINRGNHEDHVMNLRYGFIKELQMKYKKHSPKIIRLYEDVFSWLPLATVIDDEILVCHGGISDTTNLEAISRVDRHRYMSALQPPGGCEDITKMSHEELLEWKQVLDLLWSDPKATVGCSPNTFRGGGSYFGPDVTMEFLRKNSFKLLIRSHECKAEGYEYMHDDKVLTIFSASSYYEEGSNKGAFLRIQGPDHQQHIVQYISDRSQAYRKITFTQRVNKIEQSAILDLKERMIAYKTDLMSEFKKHDPKSTGEISCMNWCTAMESVLGMELPWRTLRSKLVQTNDSDAVLYETSFEQLQVRHRHSMNGPSVTESLYKHKDNLETIFRLMDTDHSGYISMKEFEDALTILMKQLNLDIKQQEIMDIAVSLDINKDGHIDFNEFLEAFRIVDGMGKEKPKRMSQICELDDITEEAANDDVNEMFKLGSGDDVEQVSVA